MANIIPIEQASVPAYLANRPNGNAVFAAGLPQGGGFPLIGLKGTRFVIKENNSETAIPKLEISVVLLGAKAAMDRNYYQSKYDPNATEAKSPDCFSRDGVRPDAAAVCKQAEACAGCPQNQYGSSMGADGNPGKGKACAESKLIALFANNGVYGFKVPPASLKAFGNYVKETSRRNIDLSTVITVIGFDANFSYPVLTFTFGGFLAEAQVNKIDQLKDSDQVAEIVGGTAAPVLNAPALVEKAVVAPKPTPDPFASVEASTEDLFAEPVQPKVAKTRIAKAKPEAAPVVIEAAGDDDAELAALLGI